MIDLEHRGVDAAQILIVDSHEQSREQQRLLLDSLGFNVVGFSTTSDAFRNIIETERPSIVLLRANEELEASEAFCELVRNTSVTYQPYIITFSETSNHTLNERLLLAGADSWHELNTDSRILRKRIDAGLRHLGYQLSLHQQNQVMQQRNDMLEATLRAANVGLFYDDLIQRRSTPILNADTYLRSFPLSDVEQVQLTSKTDINLAELQLAEEHQPIEFKIRCADRKEHWLEQSTFSTTYVDHEPVGRVSLVRDLTEQRARERELAEQIKLTNHLSRSLTEIMAISDIGVFEYDRTTEDFICNSNTAKILFNPQAPTLDQRAIPKSQLLEKLSAKSRADFEALLNKTPERPETVEQSIRSLDGRAHQLRITSSTSTSEPTRVTGTLLDLTHEHALLADRDQALEQSHMLHEQLIQRDEERSRLFAIISHEIRTPLAALKMLAEESKLEQSVDRGGQILSLIDQSLGLLTDMRSVINPVDKEPTRAPEACSLTSVIEDALDVVRPILDTEGLVLEKNLAATTDLQYLIDRQGLRRVLVNLIKNAAIHSGGSKIGLSVDLVPDADDPKIFHISVIDNGRGIPRDKRESLFEPFSRGDTSRDGSGLGLMIVKKIIEEMSGSIHCVSPKGVGAKFLIELPLQPVAQTPEKKSTTEANPIKDRTILYAEDNEMLRILTQKVVAKLDPKLLVVAEDGADALTKFNEYQGRFDIVITDIFMPHMSGYDLVSKLREQGFEGRIIGLTAATLGDETDRLIELGANQVIEKPLNQAKLLELDL